VAVCNEEEEEEEKKKKKKGLASTDVVYGSGDVGV
jgi:hypothetical protein